MPPRVAVALRVLERRVVRVDRRVHVVGADAVVVRVGDLARGDAAREVPDEAVVERRGRDGRVVHACAAAEERQLLVEEGLHLVVEAEEPRRRVAVVDVRRDRRRAVAGAEPDRRVERVGVRLVAEQDVEVGKPLRREEELLVRVGVVEPERERHRLCLVEERLVELDEADVRKVVLAERDVPRPRRARLADHRDRCLGRIGVEVLHPLRERRNVVDAALYPALGERGAAPAAPPVAHHGARGRTGLSAVAHHVVGVHEVRERVALSADREAGEPAPVVAVEHVLVDVLVVAGHRPVFVGDGLLPLELVVIGLARERLGVEDRQLLRE